MYATNILTDGICDTLSIRTWTRLWLVDERVAVIAARPLCRTHSDQIPVPPFRLAVVALPVRPKDQRHQAAAQDHGKYHAQCKRDHAARTNFGIGQSSTVKGEPDRSAKSADERDNGNPAADAQRSTLWYERGWRA